MVELTHYLDFFDQGLFSILFTVGSFFRESFDCIFFLVLVFDDEIDRGEISLSYFFDRFEQFMETSLIYSRS